MPAVAQAATAVIEDIRRPADLRGVLETDPTILLDRADARGRAQGLSYAGSLYPPEAWRLVQAGVAVLLDVRTLEELKFVGQVPDSQHLAWQTGPSMLRNPRFLRDFKARFQPEQIIILLCRSGKRSAAAAQVVSAAGYTQVFNVLEGFEGDLDLQQQRGEQGGWRHWGLPWSQD